MIEKVIAHLKDDLQRAARYKQIATGVLFVSVLLALVFMLPWSEIWQVLKAVQIIELAAGLLVVVPVYYFTAIIYHIIAQSQGMQIRALQFFWINFSVGFYQLFLPATFFGSGLRLYKYARHSNMPVQSFATIAYFKVFNIFLALMLGTGLLLVSSDNLLQTNILSIAGLFAAIAGLMILLPRVSFFMLKRLEQPLAGIKQEIWQVPVKIFLKVLKAFVDFRELKLSNQIQVILLGIASQVFHIFSYYFLAESIGISLTLSQLGVMRAVLLLAKNLPVNLLPGVGLQEVSLVGLLTAMGIDPQNAIAMSVLVFSRTVFYGLPGGIFEVVWLLKSKKKHSIDLIGDVLER